MHLRAMGAFGTQPGEMDTIVLGCTHYPFVSETIRALVGSDIALLEGGQPVARRTRALLAERSILCTQGARACVPRFYSTGDKDILNFAAMRWLGLTAQSQFLDGP
jgi:glutamate racemase